MTDKGATKVMLGPETFHFGRNVWDIDRAKKILLRKRKIELHVIDVADLKPIAGLMGINWDRVRHDIALPPAEQTINLNVPLILIMMRKGAFPFPIDGWHRVGKAILTDTPQLPAVLLSAADERKVRIAGPKP